LLVSLAALSCSFPNYALSDEVGTSNGGQASAGTAGTPAVVMAGAGTGGAASAGTSAGTSAEASGTAAGV